MTSNTAPGWWRSTRETGLTSGGTSAPPRGAHGTPHLTTITKVIYNRITGQRHDNEITRDRCDVTGSCWSPDHHTSKIPVEDSASGDPGGAQVPSGDRRLLRYSDEDNNYAPGPVTRSERVRRKQQAVAAANINNNNEHWKQSRRKRSRTVT